MTKYHAIKTTLDGIEFDSKREARRWAELRLLERAGQISGLKRQVEYELAPGVKISGEKRARPAMRYRADFQYWHIDDGLIVEDSKGMDTPISRLKRHLMATIHSIHVRLV